MNPFAPDDAPQPARFSEKHAAAIPRFAAFPEQAPNVSSDNAPAYTMLCFGQPIPQTTDHQNAATTDHRPPTTKTLRLLPAYALRGVLK